MIFNVIRVDERMICKGGMGEVTKRLAERAIREGARIETDRAVIKVLSEKDIFFFYFLF